MHASAGMQRQSHPVLSNWSSLLPCRSGAEYIDRLGTAAGQVPGAVAFFIRRAASCRQVADPLSVMVHLALYADSRWLEQWGRGQGCAGAFGMFLSMSRNAPTLDVRSISPISHSLEGIVKSCCAHLLHYVVHPLNVIGKSFQSTPWSPHAGVPVTDTPWRSVDSSVFLMHTDRSACAARHLKWDASCSAWKCTLADIKRARRTLFRSI
jgi:hypothetical protein